MQISIQLRLRNKIWKIRGTAAGAAVPLKYVRFFVQAFACAFRMTIRRTMNSAIRQRIHASG